MAPKKKPKADGDGPDLFEEFVKKYNKNQKEFETPKLPAMTEIIRKMEEEDVKAWCFYDEFDPMSFRILFHSLRQTNFPDIEALRVWKCNGGDESVRSVCYYLDMQPPPNVKDLQFTDNGVTPLGCEFLGRTLGPTGNTVINLLKLDYNQFGTAGVEKLALGLSQNATLRHLSLQYCGIAEDGGQYISHILMFFKCALEVLMLRGNYLQDKGVIDVLNGARRSKTLTQIDLYDNKFSDSPEVIKTLRELFANNTALTKYDLSGNRISEAGASALVNGMIGHNHLDKVLVTEQVSSKTWEALEEVTAGKGKKKGKKRK
mmetsp:Transcript_11749/g.30154  ORF Transcript_11749/g.30154 Transcript_11749/m.30154 type:complete len:317 (-) Transcript_11749:51-1001(-)